MKKMLVLLLCLLAVLCLLPALSLGFIHAAYMMRMTKASMLEVLGSDTSGLSWR